MIGGIKTSFEKEQVQKDQAFLELSSLERLDYAQRIREKMRRPDVNYSFSGMVVRVQKS